jgi:SEC-C motif
MSEKRTNDAIQIAEDCLGELRALQAEMATIHVQRFELFAFGIPEFESKRTVEEKLELITRACAWDAMAMKTEMGLKLLYSIGGYLAAVKSENPISTFLLARYLLELAATVSAIDFELRDCLRIELKDWVSRGISFMLRLLRARVSTSDEDIKLALSKMGLKEAAYKPIRMSKAIKQLTARPHFAWAHSAYGRLSNVCHHNGSGHLLFIDSSRETNSIDIPKGGTLFLNEKTWAATWQYPVSGLALTSLKRTAQIAWWSAKSTKELINKMPESPFTDKEVRKITHGRLSRISLADVSVGLKGDSSLVGGIANPGRNELCPCGSGKKFKSCCWKKWN